MNNKGSLLTGTKMYEFPVILIEEKDLLDSTGAGDSFVAGE